MQALTVDDAVAVLEAIAGFDPNDPFSRRRPLQRPVAASSRHLRIGVPHNDQRVFHGDRRAADNYSAALDRLARLGGTIIEIDIEPFYEAGRLLYRGPWVAERYVAARALIASAPESLHPVTREILVGGARPTAADAFAAFYRLKELRRATENAFAAFDVLAVPTAPTLYTVEQILADPFDLNFRLGLYTTFVNLLDLCALAVPSALENNRPFGISLIAPAGNDGLLATRWPAFPRGHGVATRCARQPVAGAATRVPRCGSSRVDARVVTAAHFAATACAAHDLRGTVFVGLRHWHNTCCPP